MKHIIVAFIFAVIASSCGQPASRGPGGPGDGSSWLMKDGRAQTCIDSLRRQGRIAYNQPVALYPDYVNIFVIRQSNPGTYSATETEFKSLCQSIGITIDPNDPNDRI